MQYAVAASGDFSDVAGKVGLVGGNELVAVGHCSAELVVEESAGEVGVS